MIINDNERKRRGREAEDYICSKMEEHGCQIVTRNYYAGRFGEIDIIARFHNKLLFVEVRSRQTNSKFGSPLDSISSAKLRKMHNSIEIYLQRNNIMNTQISVLAAAVYVSKEGHIEKYEIVPVENL